METAQFLHPLFFFLKSLCLRRFFKHSTQCSGRNHSNSSVTLLYRTQTNLIERSISVKELYTIEEKSLRECSIKFFFRIQSNQSRNQSKLTYYIIERLNQHF